MPVTCTARLNLLNLVTLMMMMMMRRRRRRRITPSSAKVEE
jgi:hypothetical protein